MNFTEGGMKFRKIVRKNSSFSEIQRGINKKKERIKLNKIKKRPTVCKIYFNVSAILVAFIKLIFFYLNH